MKKVPRWDCDDCGRPLTGTDRHWTHVTYGGLLVEHFCEACMLGQVNDYAERTIMGMLDGQVEVRVNGQAFRVVGARVVGEEAVKPERSEP
jgi:hypothetical protein